MRWTIAAIVCVAVAAGIGLAAGASLRRSRAHHARVERVAELDARVWPLAQAIDEGAEYLVRVNGPDGRFVYRRFTDGREGPAGAYSVVRHAGTIYALSDYARSAGEARRARAAATVERASTYLLSRYVRPLAARPELLAVWSDPEEEAGRLRSPVAKLGGAGLALAALASGARLGERDAGRSDAGAYAPEIETMRGLARFVCFMQQPSGAFYAQYDDEQGYIRSVESLYFPGEAILGLTMLYELDPDERWREAAARGIAYLVESRRGASSLPNDHWLMIAIARFLPHHTGVSPLTSVEMLAHAIELGRTMMREQADVLATSREPDIVGAFDAEGLTTPAATRLEGLLALERAVAGMPEHASVREELRRSISLGAAFLRRSQLSEGVTRGGFPQSPLIAARADAPGASIDEDVAHSAREVRIDYVQHALSALIGYAEMSRERGPTTPGGSRQRSGP